jgi:hypothetical protein
MGGSIYVIKAGADNYFWEESRKRKIAVLMLDKPYFDAWASGDRDAHLAIHLRRAGKGYDPSTVKGESTRWFNYATNVANSSDDLFINIRGKEVWWARSIASEPVIIEFRDPVGGQDVVALGTKVDTWSQFTKAGVKLHINTIHKSAWSFLKKLPALAPVADEDMKLYLTTLFEGGDLSAWHARAKWKAIQGDHSLTLQSSLLDIAIANMVLRIEQTAAFANGQIIDKKVKDKKLLDCTPIQLNQRFKTLWEEQRGRCALTGIKMHLPGQLDEDEDLLMSPDRIDSDGHYSLDNVQLVCRFANYWKLASSNERFKELLDLIIETKGQASA